MAVFDPKAGGFYTPYGRALVHSVADQGRDIGAGIAALAVFLDQHGEFIVPVERRLALAQFVFVQFQPVCAVVAADFPGQCFRFEGGSIGECEQDALAGNQIAGAGFLGQFAVAFRRVDQQRPQGLADGGDFRGGGAGGQKPPQPGQHFR